MAGTSWFWHVRKLVGSQCHCLRFLSCVMCREADLPLRPALIARPEAARWSESKLTCRCSAAGDSDSRMISWANARWLTLVVGLRGKPRTGRESGRHAPLALPSSASKLSVSPSVPPTVLSDISCKFLSVAEVDGRRGSNSPDVLLAQPPAQAEAQPRSARRAAANCRRRFFLPVPNVL